MRGFIEVKEDTYEDTIEHLHRLKAIACKLIKKLSEDSELYGEEDMRGEMREDMRGGARSDRDGNEYENEWSLSKRRMPSRYKY